MSGLAKWAKSEGAEVSGSDAVFSDTLIELADLGIKAYAGSNAAVVKAADFVVYTSSIADDDAEIIAAKSAGVPLVKRQDFLGALSRGFKRVIAVSGTHGKTTTTALLACVYSFSNKKFTAHIGGTVPSLGGNFIIKGTSTFITEACEYRESFLSLSPTTAIILNMEADHPDCYADLSLLVNAFKKFALKTRKDGFIVVNGDINYSILEVPEGVHMFTFGFSHMCDCYADNIIEHKGICEYDVVINKKTFAHIRSPLMGHHNIYNVLACALAAHLNGVSASNIAGGVENFKGVKRRFEDCGRVNGARVIHDYAHHASEINAVLRVARELTEGNLRVYFQPHTFSRTAKYFDNFVEVLSGADELCLLKTYAAREKENQGKSAFDLFMDLEQKVKHISYFQDILTAAAHLSATAMPADTVLILGAGDIVDMCKLLPLKN